MTDFSAESAAGAVGRCGEEASPDARDEGDDIRVISDDSSNAGHRSLDDVDDRHGEGSSAVGQCEAGGLEATDAFSDGDKGKTGVENLSKGIASVLGPVMNSFDSGIEGVLHSQNVLSSSIIRLTRELDRLLEDVPYPYTTHHASRISGIRKRVTAMNTTLRMIQKRMERIQRLVAGHASRAASGKEKKGTIKGSVSASPDVSVMGGLPSSSHGADEDKSDNIQRVDNSEEFNASKNIPSECREDSSFVERDDLEDNLMTSSNHQAAIGQKIGDKSIAGNESIGELDRKGL